MSRDLKHESRPETNVESKPASSPDMSGAAEGESCQDMSRDEISGCRNMKDAPQ